MIHTSQLVSDRRKRDNRKPATLHGPHDQTYKNLET